MTINRIYLLHTYMDKLLDKIEDFILFTIEEKKLLYDNLKKIKSPVKEYIIGQRCYEEEDYENAYHQHFKAIESKYANSYNCLGVMFQDGKFVNKDIKKAVELYQSAKQLKCGWASYNLGLLYETDNIEKAYNNFKEGADLGCAGCIHKLAIFYLKGLHVKSDEKKVYELLISNQNYSPSLIELAKIYYMGIHVEKNVDTALKCVKKGLKLSYLPEGARENAKLLLMKIIKDDFNKFIENFL